MKPLSQAIQRIGTENAFAVGPEINDWEKKGYNIVKLTIGEPGGNIDEAATKAAIDSFRKHETHYTPSQGIESLRKVISRYLRTTRKVDYQAQDILMTPGGKPVIAATILSLINPGDEVVYPTPCYPIYESMIDFARGKGRPILLKEENDFCFDLADLKKVVNKKTKLLILNSPSNPTGGVLKEKHLKEIAKLAKEYDFYVLSDEIYSRMVYGNDFSRVKYGKNSFSVSPSIASQPGMTKRTILLDGFSKTYAMTGLRLGFAATKNEQLMAKFTTFAINLWSCLPMPCLRAAEKVLQIDQKKTQEEMALYQQKRDILVERLNKIRGISCHQPKGAFYLFPNVTQACHNLGLKDAEEMRRFLLTYDKKNKKGVAVLTRSHFGRRLKQEKEEYIRLSFAGSISDLKEGARRIKEAVEGK